MDRVFQIKAKIVYNKRIKHNYFKSIFSAPTIASSALPGQFVEIKVSDSKEPLLRRPFSIHRVNGAKIEILYEVLGKGTEILSQRKVGEYLDIIGPLGNGFNYGQRATPACRSGRGNGQHILVAGGMGVAPLVLLAEKLFDQRPKILIGAKTKKQILCQGEFKKMDCEVKVATDDGSRGFKGKVTELLKEVLRLAISNKRLAIYACGPRPMLKEIANISKKYRIPAQISLEEHMACGIGACLGCVVRTEVGYQRVCKEGPVFAADEIVWEDNDE